MRLTTITPPGEEPWTLEELKNYLRVDHTADDVLIASLAKAARLYCEMNIRRALVSQTLELALDDWPNDASAGYWRRDARRMGPGFPGWLPGTAADPIKLPKPPLISVVSVQYRDQAGSWQTMDPSTYEVSKSEPAKIAPAVNLSWPLTHSQGVERVRVRYIAGYGAAADVPETVRAAIKVWIAHLYWHRGDDDATPPAAVAALLSTEDYGRYA